MNIKTIGFTNDKNTKGEIPKRRNNIHKNLINEPKITTTRRYIKNIYLKLRLKYQNNIDGMIVDKEDDFVLYRTENIEEAFKRFTTSKKIIIYTNKETKFYIIRVDKLIPINKNIEIQNLGLKPDDKILVITIEDKFETILILYIMITIQ